MVGGVGDRSFGFEQFLSFFIELNRLAALGVSGKNFLPKWIILLGDSATDNTRSLSRDMVAVAEIATIVAHTINRTKSVNHVVAFIGLTAVGSASATGTLAFVDRAFWIGRYGLEAKKFDLASAGDTSRSI